jgi:hypothetical protein
MLAGDSDWRSSTRSWRWRRLEHVLLVLAAWLSAGARAGAAEPSSAARDAFAEGTRLVKEQRWAEALGAFEHAQSQRPHATTAFNIGFCLRALGRYTAAATRFREALRREEESHELGPTLAEQARLFEVEAASTIGRVAFVVTPADAAVAIDGRSLEASAHHDAVALGEPAPSGTPLSSGRAVVELDPGRHLVALTHQGFSRVVVPLDVRVGATLFVDRTEWSVRRFLDAGGVALDLPPSAGGGATCANASMPSAPATCMTPIEAERICRAAGGRLPTFHELSFLIGGLRNQRYPWGSDTPSCNDAVIERFEVEGAGQRCSSANLGGFPVGPVPASEPYGRDVLTLPGGDAILHLVGNVSEIVRGTDQFLCRTTSSVMDDPRCSTNVWTQMGGSYLILRGADSVAATMATGDAKITTGFRCVYDAPRATRSRMAQDFPL